MHRTARPQSTWSAGRSAAYSASPRGGFAVPATDGIAPSTTDRPLTVWESIAPRPTHRAHDIVDDMTDILIRDVPDEVVAAVDANAQRSGQTRAEYLRRLLAEQQRPALTREQLNRFAERTADLDNPEVMAAAWR
jgi:hypothetical protein